MMKSVWLLIVMMAMMACGAEEASEQVKVFPDEDIVTVEDEVEFDYTASYMGLLDGNEINIQEATDIFVSSNSYGTKYDLYGTIPNGDTVMIRLSMFESLTLDSLEVGSHSLSLADASGIACLGPAPNSWAFDDQAESFEVDVFDTELGRDYTFTMGFNDASGNLTSLVTGAITQR